MPHDTIDLPALVVAIIAIMYRYLVVLADEVTRQLPPRYRD